MEDTGYCDQRGGWLVGIAGKERGNAYQKEGRGRVTEEKGKENIRERERELYKEGRETQKFTRGLRGNAPIQQ